MIRPLQALRDFHSEREKQGAGIVKANVEALEKLFDFALKVKSSQAAQAPAAQPAPVPAPKV